LYVVGGFSSSVFSGGVDTFPFHQSVIGSQSVSNTNPEVSSSFFV
jgi:hypothetical protein